MAVSETVNKVKVYLDLSKGSQTISNCQLNATADQLYEIGEAVGGLHEEEVQKIIKITEAELA